MECNAKIVPIALNQIDKDIYIKFGTTFHPDTNKELTESIADLRDILATLKWDILEHLKETREDGFIKRSSLDDNYWPDYLTERVKEWPMTDLEEECNYVFHPRGEAFEFFEEFNTRRYLNGEEKEVIARIWRKENNGKRMNMNQGYSALGREIGREMENKR